MTRMFGRVLASEVLKLHRSKVPWATLAGLSLGPLGLALFMWILSDPQRARELGLLGAKASLSGLAATWPSYAAMLTVIVGISGMVVLPFIVAYIFGREYEDRTAKVMLTLPVARAQFALAKLVVALLWWTALVGVVMAEAIMIGLALGLPGGSQSLLVTSVGDALLAAGLSYLLVPVVAWVTTAAQGLMAPIGFALAMLALGNLLGHTGWSVWFPWSIIPSLIGMVGNPVESLPLGSYLVIGVVFVAGVAGTILQLRLADNAQ